MRRWPNKVAIHFVDDGRKLTFQEIDLQANKVAHLLAKHVSSTSTSLAPSYRGQASDQWGGHPIGAARGGMGIFD